MDLNIKNHVLIQNQKKKVFSSKLKMKKLWNLSELLLIEETSQMETQIIESILGEIKLMKAEIKQMQEEIRKMQEEIKEIFNKKASADILNTYQGISLPDSKEIYPNHEDQNNEFCSNFDALENNENLYELFKLI